MLTCKFICIEQTMTSVEIYPLKDKIENVYQRIITNNPKRTFNANELFKLCGREGVDIGFGVEDIQYKLDTCQYIFILQDGETIKGFAIVQVTGYHLFVAYLCTEVNKQGYGTTLLNAIKNSAANPPEDKDPKTGKQLVDPRGVQLVATKTSKSFYLKNGFKEKYKDEDRKDNVMECPAPCAPPPAPAPPADAAASSGGKSRKRKTRRRKTFRLSRKKY